MQIWHDSTVLLKNKNMIEKKRESTRKKNIKF